MPCGVGSSTGVPAGAMRGHAISPRQGPARGQAKAATSDTGRQAQGPHAPQTMWHGPCGAVGGPSAPTAPSSPAQAAPGGGCEGRANEQNNHRARDRTAQPPPPGIAVPARGKSRLPPLPGRGGARRRALCRTAARHRRSGDRGLAGSRRDGSARRRLGGRARHRAGTPARCRGEAGGPGGRPAARQIREHPLARPQGPQPRHRAAGRAAEAPAPALPTHAQRGRHRRAQTPPRRPAPHPRAADRPRRQLGVAAARPTGSAGRPRFTGSWACGRSEFRPARRRRDATRSSRDRRALRRWLMALARGKAQPGLDLRVIDPGRRPAPRAAARRAAARRRRSATVGSLRDGAGGRPSAPARSRKSTASPTTIR